MRLLNFMIKQSFKHHSLNFRIKLFFSQNWKGDKHNDVASVDFMITNLACFHKIQYLYFMPDYQKD